MSYISWRLFILKTVFLLNKSKCLTFVIVVIILEKLEQVTIVEVFRESFLLI